MWNEETKKASYFFFFLLSSLLPPFGAALFAFHAAFGLGQDDNQGDLW